MEPVFAGQHRGFVALVEIVDANGTFSLAIGAQHLLVHHFALQFAERVFSCRGSRVVLRVLLHQLRNDAIQGLLGIYGVTVRSVGRVEHVENLVKKRRPSTRCPLALTRTLHTFTLGRSCSGQDAAEDRLKRIASRSNRGVTASLMKVDGTGSDREACGASGACSVVRANVALAAKENTTNSRGASFFGRRAWWGHTHAKFVDHVNETPDDLVAIIRICGLACVRVRALSRPMGIVPYCSVNDKATRTTVQLLFYVGLLGIRVVIIYAYITPRAVKRGTLLKLPGIVVGRDNLCDLALAARALQTMLVFPPLV